MNKKEMVHENVHRHWASIANGEVPFGYIVED